MLGYAARHGRLLLVLGLIGGFTLPGLAQAMKPALPAMVAGLIFISALRIGWRAAVGNVAEAGDSLRRVLILQIAVPLGVLGVLSFVSIPAAVLIDTNDKTPSTPKDRR